MADPVDFRHFNFHIVAVFAEYFNDVEQYSYMKLTEEWWLELHAEVCTLLDGEDELNDKNEPVNKSAETQDYIWEKVLAEFKKDFLNEKQVEELKEQLSDAFSAYKVYRRPAHYCGDPSCDGDCGVQQCGVCIDCCRCPMYW
jgi:hypothetical protein